jgi:RND family efflux transporter MFP subunit
VACADKAEEAAPPANASQTPPPTAVPVHALEVTRANLDVLVTAPGHTEALLQDRVRSPFAARLVSLRTLDGDRVRAGQVVAEVLSKNSEAELRGAQGMLADAASAADSIDARQAIALAQHGQIRQTLSAPAAGVVLSHAAVPGDYVEEGEVLLTIAEEGAVVFAAQVSQGELAGIKPGQSCTVEIPAAGKIVGATVHGVLPTASSNNLSAPVRLDFDSTSLALTVGLFGTASIVVNRHENATVVPRAALLRDDVGGQNQIALVQDGVAHWLAVKTGIIQNELVEITSPPLKPGVQVITEGQVGLPEGAHVQVTP